MDELGPRLAAMHVYPIKSCAGVDVTEALLIETGLQFDRAWMVVDADGSFVSQRERPRLALVQPRFRADDLVLKAPGMLALHLSLDAVQEPCRVRVWDDSVAAFDMGDLAAQWFSDFLQARVRLVRFDPGQRRLSSPAWTGDIAAENAFSDGFPLLVASAAALDELNARLAARGQAPVTMARFRPNLVLAGVDAHAEDFLAEIRFETPTGPVRLKPVKPCVRCTIPSVDPATGVQGHEPGDTLATYRADPRMDGGITFGMNAVVAEGLDGVLKVGMPAALTVAF